MIEVVSTAAVSSTGSSARKPRLACIAFTQAGVALARRVAEALEAAVDGSGRWDVSVAVGTGPSRVPLARWVDEHFDACEALLFVGSTGIAVRAVASRLRSKATDPAVLAMDESGHWCVSLLSGHIGGANRLAELVAASVGATPVVTTATDNRGLWAVDEWAARSGLLIDDVHAIKAVSSRLLAGGPVRVYSDVCHPDTPPAGVELTDDLASADVVISPWDYPQRPSGCLWLLPRTVRVGMGCRRGIAQDAVEAAWRDLVESPEPGEPPLDERSVTGVCSIDLKAHEEGLLGFCRAHGWGLVTYPAETLRGVTGVVSPPSEFVASVTGVDNVCERAALVGGGQTVMPKRSHDGVTVALALEAREFPFDLWRARGGAEGPGTQE